MAWEVPNFHIPVQVNQGQQIASYADRLMGAYDDGRTQRRQSDVLDARKSLAAENLYLPDGSVNPTYAQRLLGAGDLEGARVYQGLGQQAEERAYQRGRDKIQDDFQRQRIDIARQTAGKGDQPKFGMNPIYGVDKDNNPIALQLGSDGVMRAAQMPPGVTLSGKPIVSDTGTHFVFTDPVTRQVTQTIPKNVQAAAAAKAQGTAQGEAAAQLPAQRGNVALMDQQITDLAQDPYLPNMLGPLMSRLPNVSAEAARVQSRIDQLSGGAFLQARQALKGGGAITDFESRKAEAALARLNTAQNPADFKAALEEFRSAIKDGLAKLEQVARDPNSTMANAQSYVPPTPTPGSDKNEDRARPGVQGAPVRVSSPEEAARLPRGTRFITPDGREKVVP